MSVAAPPAFPFTLDIEPPAAQSRLTIFFRYILAIPHLIIVAALGIAVEVLVVLSWFIILFTGRMPGGIASFIVGVYHWAVRSQAYVYLLTGRYPPFALGSDESYPVRLAGEAQLEGRNRLTVLLRIILVIPHAIVLYILQIVASILLFIGWVVGIFAGRIPGFIHTFVAGYFRWNTRVGAYMLLLTDTYPPFSMS